MPDTSPTERTTRKEYHLRLPERDVSARPNIERMRRTSTKVGWSWNAAVQCCPAKIIALTRDPITAIIIITAIGQITLHKIKFCHTLFLSNLIFSASPLRAISLSRSTLPKRTLRFIESLRTNTHPIASRRNLSSIAATMNITKPKGICIKTGCVEAHW